MESQESKQSYAKAFAMFINPNLVENSLKDAIKVFEFQRNKEKSKVTSNTLAEVQPKKELPVKVK